MTTQTEALELALDEIKRVKEICLREVGIGLCNEVVIAKLEEALANHIEDNLTMVAKQSPQRSEDDSHQQVEPVAWQERQAKRISDGVVTEWTNWYPCRYRTIDEARAEACDHIPYEWRPLYTHPPVPTAQPDCTRSHPHEEMSKECELRTEIARLTNCLKRTNAQAEHFEREWYLRGDEIERLKAQPEQEPVAWMFQHEETGRTMCVDAQQLEWGFEKGNPRLKKIAPLYTTPPKRTWVGLTDEEELQLAGMMDKSRHWLVAAVEAKLKEKNGV